MFLGYFDESADQTEKKIFVVGGFLGHYEQWPALERRRKELLEKYEIHYYHAVEAQHARKQFAKPPYRTNPDPSARLTQEQCRFLENVRKDFLSAILGKGIFALAIGIPMAVFNEVADSAPGIRERLHGKPFSLCAHLAMMITAVESVRYELRSKDLVKFTFELPLKTNHQQRRALPHFSTLTEHWQLTFRNNSCP